MSSKYNPKSYLSGKLTVTTVGGPQEFSDAYGKIVGSLYRVDTITKDNITLKVPADRKLYLQSTTKLFWYSQANSNTVFPYAIGKSTGYQQVMVDGVMCLTSAKQIVWANATTNKSEQTSVKPASMPNSNFKIEVGKTYFMSNNKYILISGFVPSGDFAKNDTFVGVIKDNQNGAGILATVTPNGFCYFTNSHGVKDETYLVKEQDLQQNVPVSIVVFKYGSQVRSQVYPLTKEVIELRDKFITNLGNDFLKIIDTELLI